MRALKVAPPGILTTHFAGMQSPSFLIVRIAALGDIALTTPLLTRIAHEHPGARVTWLCGRRVAELVRLFPGVTDVIEVDETQLFGRGRFPAFRAVAQVWRQLATRQFDRVLLLHPDPRYRVVLWPLWRIRTHVLQHPPGPATNPIPARFRGDECARLLDQNESRGPIHRRFDLVDLRERVPRDALAKSAPRAVLVPGGARNILREDALRRWPLASYVALARELLSAGVDVVLIGDQGDIEFGRAFGGLRVQNLIGETTLTLTLQTLRNADVVVTHDTGPLHLARLVRAPTVALFGPTDPAQFVGRDSRVTVLWGGADLACRPCYDGRNFASCADNICINRVGVEEVLTAVRRVLTPGVPSHV